MKIENKVYKVQIRDKEIVLESGKLASQAGGAVTVRLGGTMVFASATMSSETRPGIGFFPLTVDYEERMYAGGRIPGSFFRREGRPTEEAVLTARLTDRPIRPLFPNDLRNDVQVILYSFSADGDNPIDILAVNSASAALMISDIPWDGPIAAVRVGRIENQFVINPTFEDLVYSDLDLRIAGTRDAILMVECGANEVSEDVLVDALQFGHSEMQPLIDIQEQMAAEIGKPKREYERFGTDQDIKNAISQTARIEINKILDTQLDKHDRNSELKSLKDSISSELEDEQSQVSAKQAFKEIYKNVVRDRILERRIRPDGRAYDEIRPIWCEVDVSPNAHGSGLFTRGETQVLTLVTLGTPREAQELDNLTPLETKRYIHHYNFPPFSVGETRPLRGASRRDIGHGALAEKALKVVIPAESEFPYTLRLVSEVLSSNGSSSMASVCGSTLALMDSGVPIESPVAGVAMGLIKKDDNYAILTDIQGAEDYLGDMDFKVAGTRKGITALQMDIKIKGLSSDLMSEALDKAKIARFDILDQMLKVIKEPRPDLKPHAPRIIIVNIPVDKIGAVIGPGGKTIRAIQDETGARIDIGEEGAVFIATSDGNAARMARERIEALTETPIVGHIYTGKVVRTTDFGAFVEIIPNTDGMVHISQLDTSRVNRVEDIAKVGDEITVMIIAIDNMGRIRLSRQAVLEGWTAEEAVSRDRKNRDSKRSGKRPGGSSHKGNPRREWK